MHPAVELHATHDVTDVPSIVRGAVKLGLIESVAVLLFSLASRFLPTGPVETIVLAIILLAGLGCRAAAARTLDPARAPSRASPARRASVSRPPSSFS